MKRHLKSLPVVKISYKTAKIGIFGIFLIVSGILHKSAVASQTITKTKTRIKALKGKSEIEEFSEIRQ